jgi:hypothetical protein
MPTPRTKPIPDDALVKRQQVLGDAWKTYKAKATGSGFASPFAALAVSNQERLRVLT